MRKAQRREWLGMLAGIGALVLYFGVAREAPVDPAGRDEREAAFGDVDRHARVAHNEVCERRLELGSDPIHAQRQDNRADSKGAGVETAGPYRLVTGGDVLSR